MGVDAVDPRERAAREMERNRKIEAYLRESLDGEERLGVPMDPACKVSVVIPAYAEREGIFRPLLSLARQEGVAPEEYEVIFVVNNPPSEPVRAADETERDWARKRDLYLMATWQNAQTIELVRYLDGGPMPEHATAEERAQLEEIRARGTRVRAIDKASAGRTLPVDETNVGGARNRGVAEAVERFFQRGENGIVAQSDADVRFPPDYVAALIRVFGRDPELAGIAGSMRFDTSREMEELFEANASVAELFSRYQWVTQALKAGKTARERSARVMFSGANMASRAFEAALAGGVPKIPGGEDPAFGFRLADVGKVEESGEVVTHPLDRFSARTAVSAGHGQKRLKVHDMISGSDALVESPSVAFAMRRIARELYRCMGDAAVTDAAVRAAVTADGEPLLDDADVAAVARAIRAGRDAIATTPRLRELRGEMERTLEARYPKLPIDRAVERVLAEATVDETVREAYETQLRALYADETRSVSEREAFVRAMARLLGESAADAADPDRAAAVLRAHASELGDTGARIAEMLDRDPEEARGPLRTIGGLYAAGHREPDALLSAVRAAFPDLFERPEDNDVRWTLMKLSALSRALE